MELDPPQRRELNRVTTRLVEKFSLSARPDDVERCLATAMATFESARVRTYLMLLIERAATDLLRAEAQGGLRGMDVDAQPVEHRLAS
jgi:hypothetical protein